MDWELWIRFSAVKGLYINDYLSCNRLYGDNKTQSGQWRRWREIRDMIRRYTTARWPPSLALYCLEAMIQSLRAQPWNRKFDGPLADVFSWGMKREISGRFADGGVKRVWRFSVWCPSTPPHAVTVCFTPLSRFDASRMGRAPLVITWTSTTGDCGTFSLQEDGHPQEFRLALWGRRRVRSSISAAAPMIRAKWSKQGRAYLGDASSDSWKLNGLTERGSTLSWPHKQA